MQSEKDLIKEAFAKDMEAYSPNWFAISQINFNPETQSDNDAYLERLNSFCKAMKKIRQRRNLSVRGFAESLCCTRQHLYNIENAKIKKIPFALLDKVSEELTISPAYLLGFIDDESIHPSPAQCYFWEYPKNEYLEFKEELIEVPLVNPMEFEGGPKNKLLELVSFHLKEDYTLLYSLNKIFNSNTKKKNFIVNLIKEYSRLI